MSLGELAGAMCERTARFIGRGAQRGRVARGCEANLVVFDPEASFSAQPRDVLHRHPLTPYTGRTLRGRVVTTLLRGAPCFHEGHFPAGCAGRPV